MVHRVVLGTMERFLAILTEHWGGAFPLWLSPIQVRILTVTEKEIPFAKEVYQKMVNEGIRAEMNSRNEMLGYKIRQSQLEKIPYMVIIGEREKNSRTITVRTRERENLKDLKLEDFLNMIKIKIENKES
jgi:threonyl-tRNA synthetase